jgi:hypothetical protein
MSPNGQQSIRIRSQEADAAPNGWVLACTLPSPWIANTSTAGSSAGAATVISESPAG